MLVRFGTGDREIAFGLTTTKAESDAVLAQRFRVYQTTLGRAFASTAT
jgi:hypothetical protein